MTSPRIAASETGVASAHVAPAARPGRKRVQPCHSSTNEPLRAGMEHSGDCFRLPSSGQADPFCETPHQRLSELTSIMALAVARLRKWPSIDVTTNSPDSSPIGLEPVETTCPYGLARQPERTPEA